MFKNPEELKSIPTLLWEKQCEYKVVYSDKNIVSYKIGKYGYNGGAHGWHNTEVGTLKNGRNMKLADLPSEVPALWRQAVAAHFGAESFEKYIKSPNLYAVPEITENFYLDDKGIHFIYNPYEIACYAAGTIDIFVPLKLDQVVSAGKRSR